MTHNDDRQRKDEASSPIKLHFLSFHFLPQLRRKPPESKIFEFNEVGGACKTKGDLVCKTKISAYI